MTLGTRIQPVELRSGSPKRDIPSPDTAARVPELGSKAMGSRVLNLARVALALHMAQSLRVHPNAFTSLVSEPE